jgi:hypothetical protein
MRTPVVISLLPATTGTINIVGGTTTARGSLVVSGTNATYTPNIRIPRWPEVTEYDGFGYTGLDSSNNIVSGQVNIKISAVIPDNHYLINDATTNIFGVNITNAPTITQISLQPNGGGNAIATNNVDGIVLSSTGGSNTIKYWDPVSGATGILNIGGVLGFNGTIDTTSGGTFDNDKVEYWIVSDTTGGVGETTSWFYRICFEPYITGTAPVVTVIKRGRIYSNFALNAAYLPAGGTYGDIAWDPQSKRIYVVSTNGEFGYISQDAERWDPDASGNLAYQRFSQGTVTPGQMCMTWDGRKIIAQTSAGTAVFTINRIPATAIATSLGTVTAGVGCVDASNWPSTLAIPPF